MEKKDEAMMHLREHQTYPATKADLVATCNSLSDFSEDDKQEFINALPEGTYNSADEVIKAVGWETAKA